MNFIRNCPSCNKELSYKTLGNLNWAIKLNRLCKNCSFKGKVGKYNRTKIIREQIGNGNKNKPKNWVNNDLRKLRVSISLTKHKTNDEIVKEDILKKQKRKEYNKKHKQRDNLKRNERYNNDPVFRLEVLLRSRFYKAIKNGIKFKSIIKLLGYSVENYKQYIESLWKPEMTWENHGKVWEIDHIKPCSSFDLTKLEDQQKCFHYTNLQPLFKTTDIAKRYGYNEVGNKNKYNKIL